MNELLLVNPRRKRRTTHKRRTPRRHTRRRSLSASHNPRRRRRSSPKHSIRHHVRRARSRMRSGKSFLTAKGFMNNTLIPSGIGAAGALGVDVLLGYLPLPAAIATGPMRPFVRLAGAVALGFIASKVAGNKTGEMVAAGAVTVVAYDTLKGVVRNAMPTLPGLSGYPSLEFINAGYPVGEFVANRVTPQMPVGEFVP